MDFNTKLENLAALAVRVGANVQVGQRLNISAPLVAAPFAQLLTREAYQAGASLVTILWYDDQIMVERIKHSRPEYLTCLAEETYHRLAEFRRRGDASITISDTNPEVFKDVDSERFETIMQANRKRTKEVLDQFHSGVRNWNIIPFVQPEWAAQVFPEESSTRGVERLWDAVFAATRADQPDPVGAWRAHLQDLEARRAVLNKQRLKRLEFKALGTDLTIELPELHWWEGGSAVTDNPNHAAPIRYVPNMPTEEVYTMPHRLGANGTARATKPLRYNGKIIDGIEMTFKDGHVIHARASQNEDILHQLLAADEGATRLGEVALVADSSAVGRTGLLFHSTLFDENAACHIALGKAYSYTMRGGNGMTKEQLEENGANNSQIHVDWMIGGRDMDVTGIRADGSRMALLRSGEWAFEAS
jgi:aminopeptidase